MPLRMQSRPVTGVPPTRLLREVLGDDAARGLLLLLAEAGSLRYGEARRRLDLHPRAFQRALETLEDHALVGLRVDASAPPVSTRQPVLLEATANARFLADAWSRWSRQCEAAARAHLHASLAGAMACPP